MKNSKLRRLLAVLVAFAIMLTTCGLGSFVFAADPDLVVNDGSNTATVTADSSYDVTSEDNEYTGGKAFYLTKNDAAIGAKEVTFTVNNATFANIRAFSIYVEIPELENNGTVGFTLGVEHPALVFQGEWYVVSNDGALIGKNVSTLNSGFKGEIVYMMPSGTQTFFKAAKKVTMKVNNTTATFNKDKIFTYNQFKQGFKKITKFGITLTNSVDMNGKAIVIDEIKYHFEDKDDVLNEYNLKVAAPTFSASGRVAKGAEISISAVDGAEIYYTMDGTTPTAENGIKYSEQKPVINAECTIKAIAVTEEGKSLVSEASYTFFPEDYPNYTVLNNGAQNIGQDSQHEGTSAKSEFVDGYSPYGTAVKYTGMGTSGQSMWNVKVLNQVEKSELADYAAFGMWVSVPYGYNLAFAPKLNSESNNFLGGCITYNTSTGEITEYEKVSEAKLSNFEGYVLFLTKGVCIGTNYASTASVTWKNFIDSNGLSMLSFYHSHSAYYGKTFIADEFVAVVDVDKFIDGLKAEAKRPTLPSAEIAGGIIASGEELNLFTNEGAEIYYTLDGTTPSAENGTKYSEAKPKITVDNTVLKAVSVMNGITSGVTEYTYKFLGTDVPNKMIFNDMDDVSTITNWGEYTEREIVSGVGFYGDAVSIKGISPSGAGLLTIKNLDTTTSAEVLAVKKAIAFWVDVSANDTMSFNPCIGGEQYALRTTYTTYNTATGEIKNYELGDTPKLTGFHGFVICDLTGACVRDGWTKKDAEGNDITPYVTWRERVKGGLGKIEFYMKNSDYNNKTFVMDHMVLVNDKQAFIDEIKLLPLRPLAPSADIPGGVVKNGEEITFNVQTGADVYYTVDGSDPSDASTKYDPANKPKITEPCTIKAITYLGAEKSAITEYVYTFIDSTLPNVTVLNDADDQETIKNVSNWEGLSTSRRQVEGVSPFGKAIEITGINSAVRGSLLFVKNLDTTVDANTLAVKDAIGYWINVPLGKDITFNPNINAEEHALKVEKITYNSTTGEVKEYAADEKVVLNGFEGYVIFKLKGNCVRGSFAKKDEEGNDITPWYTWRQFVTSKGLTQLLFYMNDSEFYNKTFTVDHFIAITDVDKFIEEDAKTLKSRPIAPTSEIDGGIVASGEKISFNAIGDAQIYYTTDGTTPDKNSTKFDAENPIVITESPTIVKAVAYDESKDIDYSLVTEYKFEFLGADVPNSTVINDIVIDKDGDGVTDEDVESTTVLQMGHYGERTDRVYGSEVSMFGSALTVTGINPVNTGSLMGFANLNTTLTVDQLAAHGAVAYWVSVPEGTSMNFGIRFNDEKYNIKAKIITYSTSNGDVIEYKVGEKVELNGFEGFLIYKLEGDCVRTTWSEDSYVSWRKFVKSNGLKNITFYFNDKQIYNKTFTLDRFTMVVDVDKFIEELKTLPKRPLPPSADPGSDAVSENTQIFLHTQVGNRIVYTLDGTIPTIDAEGKITNGILYETYSMGNGQEDASYIELREATTVKAMAVNLENNTSGVVTFNYTIEPPYAGPNVVVLNNGTGEGKNTWGWLHDGTFNREIVDNNSPDGKGIKATILNPEKSTVQDTTFGVNTVGVEQIHNAQGFSVHITVPDLGKDSNKMNFQPRVSGSGNYLRYTSLAISDDGETILKNITSFNGFSGTIYYQIQHPVSVSMSYGAIDMEWKKFIKNNSLTNFGFYYTCSKKDDMTDPDAEYWFEIDEISLIYDVDKLFKDINLDGLLATYDAGTYENTNMMVANDGSGNAKNAGLAGFTEGMVIEKDNYTFDERSLKLTMPQGESFINFMATNTEEELVIGDGTAFWIETPKGAGDTELGLQVYDSSTSAIELFEYADRFYYLIDKDGVISKREGAMIIPDGFRGWVLVPKYNMYIAEAEGFSIDNASLDYNQVSNIIVTFKNKKGELTGKTVRIDDISFYAYFDKIVQSRAIKWEGQVFE